MTPKNNKRLQSGANYDKMASKICWDKILKFSNMASNFKIDMYHEFANIIKEWWNVRKITNHDEIRVKFNKIWKRRTKTEKYGQYDRVTTRTAEQARG